MWDCDWDWQGTICVDDRTESLRSPVGVRWRQFGCRVEQPWHQLSYLLLISNLAPLETQVLNQSTNGLHLFLSLGTGIFVSSLPTLLDVRISRWYDFNQRGCVIITRIMNQDLVIWSGWFVPLPTLTLMIFARLLTHKDGIWLLSCKLAKRGKYCRRFLTLSSPPGNKVSWQGQVSDAGCHVMITIIRDIIMTSWHSSPHISYLRAPQRRETGSGKNFWSDLIYFSEICIFIFHFQIRIVTQNVSKFLRLLIVALEISELSHPGPRVGALGPGQLSRAHSEHINT